MPTDRGTTLYRVALAMAAAGGFSGLSHQLLWTRRMADLVGATPTATIRVLGCFFLGLSAGAALAARMGRTRRPWRALAYVEIATALLGLPLLTLPLWSTWLWPALGPERLEGWLGAGVKLLCSLVLVSLPALAMGMTLPLLARAVLTGPRTLGREGSWLYALGSAGGVLGLVATAGVTLFGVGTSDALGAAALVNVALGVVAFGIDGWAGSLEDERGAAPTPERRHGATLPFVLAFGSGLCVLAAEVFAVHLFDQVVSLAVLGATSVLFATLLPLAVASLAAAAWASRVRSIEAALANVLALAALSALCVPLLFVWQTDGLRYLALEQSPSVAWFMARAIGLGLGAFGGFVLVAGLVLPLTLRWFQDATGDLHGRRFGGLLAANGLGGLVGTELANRMLMPTLGMHLAFVAVGLVYAALAIVLGARTDGDWRFTRRTLALAGGLGLVAAVLVPRVRALPLVRLDTWPQARAGHRLVDLETGPDGTAAVVAFGDDRVILVNNQYVLGGTRSFLRQQRMALLPAVLHPAPRRVAFIGLGTGISAGGALVDPAVESVTALEISPLVADLSRRYFDEESDHFASDPRAHVVLEDGRIAIAAATDAYDLIVGDLLLPWQVGAGRLYSVEHFRAVRRALAPGGEFCQWLPMFQLTPEEFHVIVASFREAFPQASLFRDDLSDDAPAFALVGFRDGGLDWGVVMRRTLALQESGRTRDGFVAFPRLLASLYLGATHAPPLASGPRNTLDNAWIELQTGRDQTGRPARTLDRGSWDLLPQYVDGFSGRTP